MGTTSSIPRTLFEVPFFTCIRPGERYYQRAASRAVLEHIALGHNRALLSLATGTGKTRIGANLLHTLSKSGQLRRALFLCDRDELRTQALSALSHAFGSDVAAAKSNNPEKMPASSLPPIKPLALINLATLPTSAAITPKNYFSHQYY